MCKEKHPLKVFPIWALNFTVISLISIYIWCFCEHFNGKTHLFPKLCFTSWVRSAINEHCHYHHSETPYYTANKCIHIRVNVDAKLQIIDLMCSAMNVEYEYTSVVLWCALKHLQTKEEEKKLCAEMPVQIVQLCMLYIRSMCSGHILSFEALVTKELK